MSDHPVLRHVGEAVAALAPYQPGKPAAVAAKEQGIANVIKLASNENPLGPGKKALAAVRAVNAEALRLYPDSNGGALRAAISQKLGVPQNAIVLGNGSNDILELAAQLLLRPGAAAVYSRHAFVVYALAAAARRAESLVTDAPDFAHDLPAMARAANRPQARLVFVANPNNPTGTWHKPAAVRDFLRQVPPDVLVVLDEAYCEYLPEANATLPFLQEFPNLLIARTFSKIHGLAGLRAGYGLAHPSIVAMLNRVRQPFNINAVAQDAALAALQDEAHIAASVANNNSGMAQLTKEFAARGVRFIPSYGNFVSFEVGDAAAVYARLQAGGVITRQLKEYDMPQWLRVSVGTPEQNERFLRLLA